MRARRTRYGPARLSRRASGIGLERHGRHAVSRAGTTGTESGIGKGRNARTRPPDEVRRGHVKPSPIARRPSRHGREAVSRRGRQGAKAEASLSESLCVRHKLMAKEPLYATQTQG
ncbi:hypothetical protein C6P82_26900, partial [Burkholderia multivorans]